ncbi:type II toxin-antitoxin system PemK/MazF family toxin [Diaminobutyricibacter sp. McL0608]|uniref:type II toxin-antitoxin system PemK/MazF family toxin n=1 Tax=Leifsonia sp. McL0608 TaxID=3143537 RepID=UPI0031F2F3DC
MFSRLFSAIASLFRPSVRPPRPAGFEASPGQYGASATVEVDPRRVGAVTMSYAPRIDGDADPGEIVWTWVPYQERDGRGKDRPVLVVAAESAGTVLAVQLTSQEHPGRPQYIPIGTGPWDGQRRPSWVNLDRVFRLHQSGMRREASALGEREYAQVRSALVGRYGWASR